MNNANEKGNLPNNGVSIGWGLALAFAAVWLFGNWTRDIGGFKETLNVAGFPFVFASSGDFIKTSYSLTALIFDILIGVAIFAAIVAFVPKRMAQRVQGPDNAD